MKDVLFTGRSMFDSPHFRFFNPKVTSMNGTIPSSIFDGEIYTDLPTRLPVEKLTIVRDVFRGKEIDKGEAFLAALNCIGYAGRTMGLTPLPVVGVAESPQVEDAFTAILPDAEGTFAAAPNTESAWMIILPILIDIIRRRFNV